MKFKKFISSSLAIGLLLNSTSISLASILSEDGRYETFEGSSLTIPDVLEEDTVDVEIEGNTMVNVANQKDPVPITKKYTVEGTNHISLQGEYDGKVRPVIEGNTMYYNNDTGEYSNTFVDGANLSLKSSFEDQLVTQEMIDNGQEKAENLGKYKIEYKVVGKNLFNKDNVVLGGYTYGGATEDNIIEIKPSINHGHCFIKVKPNTTYRITSENLIVYARFMKSETVEAGSAIGYGKDLTVTTNHNTNYIALNIKTIDEAGTLTRELVNDSNIYIKEGASSSKYEPYKESVKTFYLNSPLLEGDTIEDIDGKATHIHRSEQVIFDGSSDEGWWNVKLSDATLFVQLIKNHSEGEIICDKFVTRYVWDEDIEGVYSNGIINSFSAIHFRILQSKLKTVDLLGWKTWLSENLMTVVYPLTEPIYETLSEESMLCDSYANGYLDLNSNIPVNKVDFIPTTTKLNYLYPSTEYTVQFESDNEGKIDRFLLGDEVLYSNYPVNKGINRFNITAPSTIQSTELILDGVGFNLSNLVVTQATDESFGYFEGIKSVGQDDENGHNIEVISNNKNLFDGELEHGYIGDSDGTLRPYGSSGKSTLNYIPIKSQMYTLYWDCYSAVAPTCYYYDKDYNYLGRLGKAEYKLTGKYTFEVPYSDAKYMKFRLYSDKNGLIKDSFDGITIQLEEGTQATLYTPHQSNILKIPLSEPLRSLPSGAKDKIIKRNGQWFVERNCAEVVLDKNYIIDYYSKTYVNNEERQIFLWNIDKGCPKMKNECIPIIDKLASAKYRPWVGDLGVRYVNSSREGLFFCFRAREYSNVNEFKKWVSENPLTIVYELRNPVYEPLNIDSSVNLYEDITHISNNSIIPANMRVVVDRAMNRAVEAVELTKINSTTENLSKARYWSNLLKESTKKDQLQSELNSITDIDNLQLERKSASSNLDVYVKSQNMLSISLDTNSITFDGYSGVDAMELRNAVNLTVNSSLPYDLNAYMPTEITNSDGSSTIDFDILNIKESSESTYQQFADTTNKVVLKSDCAKGNGNIHNIDLKLDSNAAHKADVYKTVVKFEAEQK